MRRLLAFLVVGSLFAGCGGGQTTMRLGQTGASGPTSAPCVPPIGAGGTTKDPCRASKTAARRAGVPVTSRGCQIPDVSYYQGSPNWSAARRDGACGGIYRVSDGGARFPDPKATYNRQALERLHMWHAAYGFVRPSSNCAVQARFDAARAGPHVLLIADAEVPLPGVCVVQYEREAVRLGSPTEVAYTGSGTYSGWQHDGAALWDAAYGPSPGCVWTCKLVAWQHTDGQIGAFPHCLPGFGCGDLSTDYGITRIGAAPCDAACRRHELAVAIEQRRSLRRILITHGCRWRVRQHQPVGARCHAWLVHGTRVNRQIRALGGH